MKSFEPFYAILSVYIPVSILAGFLSLVALLLGHFTGLELPLSYWFASGLLSAITASIYWGIVRKSKADHSTANIRGAILIVIIMYTLFSLLDFSVTIGMRFLPSFQNMLSAFSALLVWFPVVTIKRIFNGQELFESHTRNYEGEKLRQIMLEDSGLLSETDADIKKIISYYKLCSLPVFVLLCIAGGLGITFNLPLVVLMVFLFTMGVCIIVFLSFLRREFAFAAEGLTLDGRPRAVMAALLVIFAATLSGLMLSMGKNLLPFSVVADLFRRLFAFLRSLFSKPIPELPAPPMPESAFEREVYRPTLDFYELMGDSEPAPFWDWLKYAVITAVAVAFIWFMINPLLRRSKLFRGFRAWPKAALTFIKTWLKTLAQGLAFFFGSLKQGGGGKKLNSPFAAALRRLEDDLLEGYSQAKRKELRQSITLFARLIYWGQEALNINWKASHAPSEYCALLAAAPGAILDRDETAETKAANEASAAAILRAGALFEKALYSQNTLSTKERDEFKRIVMDLTS